MAIKQKAGVLFRGVKPELLLGLSIADGYYAREGHNEMVITSLVDGKHSVASLHYVGYAADLRIWNIDDIGIFTDGLSTELGSEFDVILETDHIHIEYQPKEI